MNSRSLTVDIRYLGGYLLSHETTYKTCHIFNCFTIVSGHRRGIGTYCSIRIVMGWPLAQVGTSFGQFRNQWPCFII